MASRVSQAEDLEVWSKPLEDGSLAVGLFNRSEIARPCTASWSDLGISGPHIVRDLWRQQDLGAFNKHFEAPIPPHGTMLLPHPPAVEHNVLARGGKPTRYREFTLPELLIGSSAPTPGTPLSPAG